MALSEIYVDPSIAADSGTGTIGDPFGDVEYAIEQTTFDTTNGTRVNVKTGVDEVLAATLNTAMADTGTTVAWAPNANAPMVVQGYTATAGDGGIGGISGGGTVSIFDSSTTNGVWFAHMHLHNCGANDIFQCNDDCGALFCEFDSCTTNAVDADQDFTCVGCYFHDITNIGCFMFGGSLRDCYFESGASQQFSTAVVFNNTGEAWAYRNIFHLKGAANGIGGVENRVNCLNNSIFCEGGTGTGIISDGAGITRTILNNLVEGFSGVGGVGISFNDADLVQGLTGGNAVYDCTTAYESASLGGLIVDLGDDETLTESPFTDAASGDFSPVDTGNVKEGSLPNAWNN